MRTVLLLLTAVSFAFSADDPWIKIKELKSGSEIRVSKKGLAQPIPAKAADVTDSKVIVIIGKEETAIAKKDIDRIDYRPPKSKPVKTETRATTTDGSGTSDSWSSSTSWGRDGWQTLYQRSGK
jgi:hypothetical protein